MKISEMIKQLEELKAQHGDVNVVRDIDYKFAEPVMEVKKAAYVTTFIPNTLITNVTDIDNDIDWQHEEVVATSDFPEVAKVIIMK